MATGQHPQRCVLNFDVVQFQICERKIYIIPLEGGLWGCFGIGGYLRAQPEKTC
ncbi:MAG: hypothetical protein ACJAVR_003487 [Paracoccaceae bacterium]|jgi:hypothetical protein